MDKYLAADVSSAMERIIQYKGLNAETYPSQCAPKDTQRSEFFVHQWQS